MTRKFWGPGVRFSMFGTPIRIGLGFPLTIVAVPFLLFGERGRDPRFLGAWLALVTVSVLVHEAGHVAALRAFGFHPDVSLNMLGGLTSTDGTGRLSPWRSIAVSLAGPAAGIALGITIEAALIPIAGREIVWLRSASWMVNIGWSLINLLPVMPLDGGHVTRELFEMASRKRGAAVAWLVFGVLTVTVGVWAWFGSDGHWAALVAFLMLATNVRFFALTVQQRKRQDIDVAHEELTAGGLTHGIDVLLPVAFSTDTKMIPDEAYTTLAWALLHERRYHELAMLDETRFHTNHRQLLTGAVAWYRGDVEGALDLVSHALGAGSVEPPDSYFTRVFGRLGEMDRLAHRIAGLPHDAALRAGTRLHTGLATAAA